METKDIVVLLDNEGELYGWGKSPCGEDRVAQRALLERIVDAVPTDPALLGKVMDRIEANPASFNMAHWCGTACCLAGHATKIMLEEVPALAEYRKYVGANYDIATDAAFTRTVGIAALMRATGSYPPVRVSDPNAVRYLEAKTGRKFDPAQPLPLTWGAFSPEEWSGDE